MMNKGWRTRIAQLRQLTSFKSSSKTILIDNEPPQPCPFLQLPYEVLSRIIIEACTPSDRTDRKECLHTAHAISLLCWQTHDMGDALLLASANVFTPRQLSSLLKRHHCPTKKLTNLSLQHSVFDSLRKGKTYKSEADFDHKVFQLDHFKSYLGGTWPMYLSQTAVTALACPVAIGIAPLLVPTAFLIYMIASDRIAEHCQDIMAVNLTVVVQAALTLYDLGMMPIRMVHKVALIASECRPQPEQRNMVKNLSAYLLLRRPKAWPTLDHLTAFTCHNPSKKLLKRLPHIAPGLTSAHFVDFDRDAIAGLRIFLRGATCLTTLGIIAKVSGSHWHEFIGWSELPLDESTSLYRIECKFIEICQFEHVVLGAGPIREATISYANAGRGDWLLRLRVLFEAGVFHGLRRLSLDPNDCLDCSDFGHFPNRTARAHLVESLATAAASSGVELIWNPPMDITSRLWEETNFIPAVDAVSSSEAVLSSEATPSATM